MNNLKRALSLFMEDIWLPFDDSIGCIDVDIEHGSINKEELKNEFDSAVNDTNFDWIKLARDSQLFISLENYENEELKEHIQNLLTLYLHSELELTPERNNSLEELIISLLIENSNKNQGWISSSDLLSLIKSNLQFGDIQSFHIWDIYLNKILYNKIPIERKPANGKERQIGYLRYKQE